MPPMVYGTAAPDYRIWRRRRDLSCAITRPVRCANRSIHNHRTFAAITAAPARDLNGQLPGVLRQSAMARSTTRCVQRRAAWQRIIGCDARAVISLRTKRCYGTGRNRAKRRSRLNVGYTHRTGRLTVCCERAAQCYPRYQRE